MHMTHAEREREREREREGERESREEREEERGRGRERERERPAEGEGEREREKEEQPAGRWCGSSAPWFVEECFSRRQLDPRSSEETARVAAPRLRDRRPR